jgi:hypothetical protein
VSWVDELAPKTIRWPGGRDLKLLYVDQPPCPGAAPEPPELQLSFTNASSQEHPCVCDGRASETLVVQPGR